MEKQVLQQPQPSQSGDTANQVEMNKAEFISRLLIATLYGYPNAPVYWVGGGRYTTSEFTIGSFNCKIRLSTDPEALMTITINEHHADINWIQVCQFDSGTQGTRASGIWIPNENEMSHIFNNTILKETLYLWVANAFGGAVVQ